MESGAELPEERVKRKIGLEPLLFRKRHRKVFLILHGDYQIIMQNVL